MDVFPIPRRSPLIIDGVAWKQPNTRFDRSRDNESRAQIEFFWPPFFHLGPLKSTLRPECAIMNCWFKLKNLSYRADMEFLSARCQELTGADGALVMILGLGDYWMEAALLHDFVKGLRPRQKTAPPPHLRPGPWGGVLGLFKIRDVNLPSLRSPEYDEPEDFLDKQDPINPHDESDVLWNQRILAWKFHASNEAKLADGWEDTPDSDLADRRSTQYAAEPARHIDEPEIEEQSRLASQMHWALR